MNKQEFLFLSAFCSPLSILVVDVKGKLRELYCPFQVMVNSSVGRLKKGQRSSVEKVRLSSQGKTVFVVDNLSYYYYYFDIYIQ